jgi:hypothetical protein
MVSVSCGDHPSILNPCFALKPSFPRRPAIPFSPRARAYRGLRRRWPARGARPGAARAPPGADIDAGAQAGAARPGHPAAWTGNLDDPASLRRLAALATRVRAPGAPARPGPRNVVDRPAHPALAQVLRRRTPPRSLVYGSTSGVYGDCGGDWVVETRPLAPRTPRAQRRVDAERWCGTWGASGVRASILRIPGIYAPDREGGTPRAPAAQGHAGAGRLPTTSTPTTSTPTTWRAPASPPCGAAPQRVVNVNDDSALKMGDYFDQAADLYGLPRPPRVPATRRRPRCR